MLTQPNGKIPVAVKMAKYSSSISLNRQERAKREQLLRRQRKLLRDELNIMAHLQALTGGHENVLKLVGAITTIRADFCVLTEYCEWGSAEHFLRNKFLNGDFENEIIVAEITNEEIWKVNVSLIFIIFINTKGDNCWWAGRLLQQYLTGGSIPRTGRDLILSTENSNFFRHLESITPKIYTT
jgi:serine/threonine protein kinase